MPAVCIFVLWRVQRLVTCTKESHDLKETPSAAAVCSVLLVQLAQRGVLLLQVLISGHDGPVLLLLLLGVGCSLEQHHNTTVADAAAAGEYTHTLAHTHNFSRKPAHSFTQTAHTHTLSRLTVLSLTCCLLRH